MNMQDILIKPVLTERTFQAMSSGNEYTFIVHNKAAKPDIKKAIESLFGVEVVTVHTMVMKGGTRKIFSKRMTVTTESNTKKAVITLKPGNSIDLFDFSNPEKKEDKKKKKDDKKEEKTEEKKAKKEKQPKENE